MGVSPLLWRGLGGGSLLHHLSCCPVAHLQDIYSRFHAAAAAAVGTVDGLHGGFVYGGRAVDARAALACKIARGGVSHRDVRLGRVVLHGTLKVLAIMEHVFRRFGRPSVVAIDV